MWCSAFDSGRTDADDKLGLGRNLCSVDMRIREDRRRKLTDIARELAISLQSAHRTVNDQLDYRKLFARQA